MIKLRITAVDDADLHRKLLGILRGHLPIEMWHGDRRMEGHIQGDARKNEGPQTPEQVAFRPQPPEEFEGCEPAAAETPPPASPGAPAKRGRGRPRKVEAGIVSPPVVEPPAEPVPAKPPAGIVLPPTPEAYQAAFMAHYEKHGGEATLALLERIGGPKVKSRSALPPEAWAAFIAEAGK